MEIPFLRKKKTSVPFRRLRKELRSLKLHLFLLFTLPAVAAAVAGTVMREYFRACSRKNRSSGS